MNARLTEEEKMQKKREHWKRQRKQTTRYDLENINKARKYAGLPPLKEK